MERQPEHSVYLPHTTGGKILKFFYRDIKALTALIPAGQI